MSGMEPILLGAAIGGGVSAATGGNPLQGALLGAAGGGLTSGLSGVGAAAQTGANTAVAPLAGVAGDTATQAINAAMIESGTSGLYGNIIEQAALSGAQYSSSPFLAGAQHLMREPGSTMAAMFPSGAAGDIKDVLPYAGQLMGSTGAGSQQQTVSAPPLRRGQAPQIAAPIEALLQEQMVMRNPRRRLSLLY